MIKYIKIDGKEYPVKYGFNALSIFQETELRGLEGIGEDMNIHELITFVWVGLKEGARAEKKDFNLTREGVADILDEDTSILEKFFEIFTSQMPKMQGEVTGGK